MPNDLAHFAIQVDDTERAIRFYETVFGWSFQPWGPPGFWMIYTSPGAATGSLYKRMEPVTGTGLKGFECTIGVDDVAGIAKAVEKAGGKVTQQPYTIETVGTLIKIEDTEGNGLCVMQYEKGLRR
jgi:predicted enzyme related to lactoylglutathione lyase